MSSAPGIPIGPMIIRTVRHQHGQVLIQIPADIADALGLRPPAYAILQRRTDNTLTVRRLQPEELRRDLPRHSPGPD